MKASNPVTLCPQRSNSSHKCEPMNPAAPVTMHFICGTLLYQMGRGATRSTETEKLIVNRLNSLHAHGEAVAGRNRFASSMGQTLAQLSIAQQTFESERQFINRAGF